MPGPAGWPKYTLPSAVARIIASARRTMTRSAIEEALTRQKDAFARRDVEALTALHAPEGTFESPAYGLVTGRDSIREIYRYWYAAFPDFILTWDSALIDPPRASYIWMFNGTAAG